MRAKSSSDVQFIHPGEPGYPALAEAYYGADAPMLTLSGNLDLLGVPSVGISGTKKPSQKGLRTAIDCAEYAVQQGFVVVSGNGIGVETAVHRAVLEKGGKTILVLPEGIDQFRIRREYKAIWDWDQVLVISQFEPKAPSRDDSGYIRNELIVALSHAMVAVEPGDGDEVLSASLSTLEFGKALFLAQYPSKDSNIKENTSLQKQGARLLGKGKASGRADLKEIAQCVRKATG